MIRERVATITGIVVGIVFASPFAWVTLRSAIGGADEAGGGLGMMVTFAIGGALTYGVFVAVALGVTWLLCVILRVPRV